jgi:hypothetical protein
VEFTRAVSEKLLSRVHRMTANMNFSHYGSLDASAS